MSLPFAFGGRNWRRKGSDLVQKCVESEVPPTISQPTERAVKVRLTVGQGRGKHVVRELLHVDLSKSKNFSQLGA